MYLDDILTVERIRYTAEISSVKQAFETLSTMLCNDSPLDAVEVFDMLIARERLGSTAVGHGVAIPHIRHDSLEVPYAALLRLSKGLKYETPDDQPVDLMCALIVPADANEAHLSLLSQLAKLFSNTDCREKLRHTEDAREMYEVTVEYANIKDPLDGSA